MSREKVINKVYDSSVADAISLLPNTIKVFFNPLYDVKKTVNNDLDFMLGVFLSQVILVSSYYFEEINFTPTEEESGRFNYILFSKAQEYKEQIQKIIEN